MFKKSQERSKNFQALATSSYQPGKSGNAVPANTRPKRRRVWLRMAMLVLALVFLTAAAIAVWDFRNFSSASQKLFGTDNVWEVLRTTQLKSTAGGRTNLLIVGYSADDPGHAGAKLTDSILILSLNKADRTGYMISIPRDLYVQIPGYGPAKINEAYQAGERRKFRQAGYPAGGIGLLQKVINESFGIEAHYYALINYAAVKDIVDALGGINVTINSEDKRGIYDPNFPKDQGGPLKLSNGVHHVDGQTALRLTRARGSVYGSYGFPTSDFNRTQNQQQVLSAIKGKLNWTLVLDPRTNGEIFNAAGNNIVTNVKIGEIVPLYRLFINVPNGNIHPANFRNIEGSNLLTDYTTPYGQSALIPAAGMYDYSQIREAITRLNQ